MEPEEKAHDATLAPAAQKAFRAKPAAERKALAKAAREVVYTSKASGEKYLASDDPRLVSMAKAADTQADAIAKRDEVIEKAEIRSLAKGLLGKLTGDDDTHDLIVKSLRKSGATAEQIEKAFATLRSGNAFAAARGVAKGSGADPEPGAVDEAGAYEALAKGLGAFAITKGIAKVWTEGLDAYAATPDGAALKRAYDDARGTK